MPKNQPAAHSAIPDHIVPSEHETVLFSLGANYENAPELFERCKEDPERAKAIRYSEQAFKLMAVSYPQDKAFINWVINHPKSAQQLCGGIFCEDDIELLLIKDIRAMDLVEKAYHARLTDLTAMRTANKLDATLKMIQALKRMNYLPETHSHFYVLAFDNADYANELSAIFAQMAQSIAQVPNKVNLTREFLQKPHLAQQGTEILKYMSVNIQAPNWLVDRYEHFGAHPEEWSQLYSIFMELESAGLALEQYPRLYRQVIQGSAKMIATWLSEPEIKVPPEQALQYYETLIAAGEYGFYVKTIVDYFVRNGQQLQSVLEWFKRANFLDARSVYSLSALSEALPKLGQYGLSVERYIKIYEAIMTLGFPAGAEATKVILEFLEYRQASAKNIDGIMQHYRDVIDHFINYPFTGRQVYSNILMLDKVYMSPSRHQQYLRRIVLSGLDYFDSAQLLSSLVEHRAFHQLEADVVDRVLDYDKEPYLYEAYISVLEDLVKLNLPPHLQRQMADWVLKTENCISERKDSITKIVKCKAIRVDPVLKAMTVFGLQQNKMVCILYPLLVRAGINYQTQGIYYDTVLSLDEAHAEAMEDTLDCLIEGGYHFEDQPEIFEQLRTGSLADLERLADLGVGAGLLKRAGYSREKYAHFYQSLEAHGGSCRRQARYMYYFAEADFDHKVDHALFNDLPKFADSKLILTKSHFKTFALLTTLGFDYAADKTEFINIKELGAELPIGYSMLKVAEKIGFRKNADHQFISRILAHPARYHGLMDWFAEKALIAPDHNFIFARFFDVANDATNSFYKLARLRQVVETVLQAQGVKYRSVDIQAYAAQTDELVEAMEEEELSHVSSMTEGPLNKSQDTRTFEALLLRMSQMTADEVDQIQMHYDEAQGYVISSPILQRIQIGLLLKSVKFSHLEIDRDVIDKLGMHMRHLLQHDRAVDFNAQSLMTHNRITARLPEISCKVLERYTCYYFENINNLMRNLPLSTDDHRTLWFMYTASPTNIRLYNAELLLNFIAGCIVNWTAEELHRLWCESPEKRIIEKALAAHEADNGVLRMLKWNEPAYNKMLRIARRAGHISDSEFEQVRDHYQDLSILFPDFDVLDRKEDFKEDDTILLQRLANPTPMQGATSVSAHEDGTAWINHRKNRRTKLSNVGYGIVINKSEAEVLLPHGETVETQRGSDSEQYHFFARLVRSPSAERQLGFLTMRAMGDAYKKYLSQHYEFDQSCFVMLDSIVVERPNHSLAHVYRVALYIDIVIDYFAHHASDPELRRYCQAMSPSTREWLRVASVYRITGREGEESFREHPKRYNSYKEYSARHFIDFCQSLPDWFNRETQLIPQLHDIIQHRGDPAFEAKQSDEGLYLYHILNFAHDLDLMRCYYAHEYAKTMSDHGDLLVQRSEMQDLYQRRMFMYVSELLQRHGNAQKTTTDEVGNLIDCNFKYRGDFPLVSTDLNAAEQISATVPYFECEEPFQIKESNAHLTQ